jgi:quercetin dioxygenase-like cupin family protein
MMKRLITTMWVSAALLAALTAVQAQAPEQRKGPTAKPLLNLDLAPEIDSVQGRVLRMQLTTYEPGAGNQPHSHKNRAEVVYILSGKIIDHRGDAAREYGPGDSFTAGRDTVHWMENKGTVPAVMLISGIAKKE